MADGDNSRSGNGAAPQATAALVPISEEMLDEIAERVAERLRNRPATLSEEMLDQIAGRVAERLRNRPPSVTVAIEALAINALVLPGMGTIVLRNNLHGMLQLMGFLVGVPLCLLGIGIPMVIAMWVWAVVDGAIGLAVALRERKRRTAALSRDGGRSDCGESADGVTERPRSRSPSVTVAIVALAINALALPGFGTILLGNAAIGTLQLLVFLIGVPLCLLAVGIPMVIAMWVWGVIDGIIGLVVALRDRKRRMAALPRRASRV